MNAHEIWSAAQLAPGETITAGVERIDALINDKVFVAVQKVFIQVSASYDTVEKVRTLVISPETTVGEVMRWAASANVVGFGDVILTEQDDKA